MKNKERKIKFMTDLVRLQFCSIVRDLYQHQQVYYYVFKVVFYTFGHI